MPIKKKTIIPEELINWVLYQKSNDITFVRSEREQKKLTYSFDKGFKVTVAGRLIWQGENPHEAVDQFNSITEKYVAPDFKL